MKVSFHTLGCKLNFAETGTMARDFRANGFETVSFGTAADVTVINTCTVTEQSEVKCRKAIRQALRANPNAFVMVTGCYAQLRPEEIAEIEGVDVVLGANEKFQIFQLIQDFSKQEKSQIHVSCADDITEFGASYSAERTRAFLKIQDGCDYSCSFCTIPLARGKSRSLGIKQTVKNAQEIIDKGFKEIVLSGINLGLYGQESGLHLMDLLPELAALEGVERYRISSIEPNLCTPEIIEFVAKSDKFMPHFHMPLQSGDNEVLGKMRRRYKRELYAERVQLIKTLMPDAAIGVDVIVGFSPETDVAFQNTVAFLEDLDITYLHVFTYSERPDTVAVDQPQKVGEQVVPIEVRRKRNQVLQMLSAKKRNAFYQKFMGTTRPILWEGSEKTGLMHGFTDNYIKVSAPFDAHKVGLIEQRQLGTFATDGSLKAEELFLSLI